MERTLKLGTAYHGGRFLHQVEQDMRDIARHNMNTVVHMYTHNDWTRRPKLMADIVKASEDQGLEVWMDNWGMDGGPGDKFFWTAIHPECKAVFADGTPTPYKPCFNQPVFRQFTKSWVDAIGETGCKTLFWDEPCFANSDEHGWSCYCPTCQKLFEERYNKKMPTELTPEVAQFRADTLVEYFTEITDYAHSCGMVNTGCIMFAPSAGTGMETIERLLAVPHFDNVGCDPYWTWCCKTPEEVYKYNYDKTKENLDYCAKFGKDHNVWVQGFGFERGRDDEMILAANAIYDAGARTIFTWSYFGGESEDYRAANCELNWAIQGELCAELRRKHFNKMLDEIRAKI